MTPKVEGRAICMLAAGKQPPESVRCRSKLGQKRSRGKENEAATPAGNKATADHTRNASGKLCSKVPSRRSHSPDLPAAAVQPVAGSPSASPAQQTPAARDIRPDSEATAPADATPIPPELQWHPDFFACNPAQRDIVTRWFMAIKRNVRVQPGSSSWRNQPVCSALQLRTCMHLHLHSMPRSLGWHCLPECPTQRSSA